MIDFFENIGEIIALPQYVAFRGFFNGDNGSITVNGLVFNYEYYFYISDDIINWNDGQKDGITVVLLKDKNIRKNTDLLNINFIYFDVIGGGIGNIIINGKQITIFEGDVDLLMKSRSTIITDYSNNCLNNDGVAFPISPDNLSIKSTNEKNPDGITICINLKKNVNIPFCNSEMEECGRGYCYYNDNMYSTNCINSDNCLKPSLILDGVNYWKRMDGKDDNCPTSTSKSITNKVVYSGDVNLIEGANTLINNSDNLKNKIINLQTKIERQKLDMDNNKDKLEETHSLIKNNEKVIKDKMDILTDRNRQLQLSIDRNIFNKKVVNTLLAVGIALVIIILFVISFVRKFKSQ